MVRGNEKGSRKEDGEEGMSRAEILGASKRLKEGKAAGIDGIPGEIWRYGGEELGRWMEELLNKVWRDEGWPENWKERIVIPIVKKGKGGMVGDYREVTLMPTLYKMYMSVGGKTEGGDGR